MWSRASVPQPRASPRGASARRPLSAGPRVPWRVFSDKSTADCRVPPGAIVPDRAEQSAVVVGGVPVGLEVIVDERLSPGCSGRYRVFSHLAAAHQLPPFERGLGRCSHRSEGCPIAYEKWRMRQRDWLPSSADRKFVSGLMKRATEPARSWAEMREPRGTVFPYLRAVGGLQLTLLPWIGNGYGNGTLRHPRLRLRRVWHAF
jgi:hypothetical protein